MSFVQVVGEQHLTVASHMAGFTALLQQLQMGNLVSFNAQDDVRRVARVHGLAARPSADLTSVRPSSFDCAAPRTG